jgi:hypothetical protein
MVLTIIVVAVAIIISAILLVVWNQDDKRKAMGKKKWGRRERLEKEIKEGF